MDAPSAGPAPAGAPASAPIIVVGAGQGGLQAAESLRAEGYDGEIVLIGAESHAPYHRPPLSKGLLLGEVTPQQLSIRQPAALEKKRIGLRTGARVESVDREGHAVVLAGGERLPYRALVLATGARPRRLPVPGGDARGVFTLRTLDDTVAIAEALGGAASVAVVGGGFIGLEMAAVARKMGKAVTVIEYADRLMARVVAPPVSAWFRDLHVRHGVDLRLGTGVTEILITADGSACGVRCSDRGGVAADVAADVVVLGIGVDPETGLAAAAGLELDRGILVDGCGRTSDPDIYAIGDCAAQRLPGGGARVLESVQNAVELAKACAGAIMGKDKPFQAPPWFWSDQYGVKLQMVGLSAGYGRVAQRGGAGEGGQGDGGQGDGGQDGGVAWFYFRDGKLIAVDTVDRPADHMAGRKLLAAPNSLTPEQAADDGFALKDAMVPPLPA